MQIVSVQVRGAAGLTADIGNKDTIISHGVVYTIPMGVNIPDFRATPQASSPDTSRLITAHRVCSMLLFTVLS